MKTIISRLFHCLIIVIQVISLQILNTTLHKNLFKLPKSEGDIFIMTLKLATVINYLFFNKSR